MLPVRVGGGPRGFLDDKTSRRQATPGRHPGSSGTCCREPAIRRSASNDVALNIDLGQGELVFHARREVRYDGVNGCGWAVPPRQLNNMGE